MKTRIEAKRLIPGRGEVIDDAVVIFEDSTLEFAGSASDAPAAPGADVIETDTVMPGMWDCHAHFLGVVTAAPFEEMVTTRPQITAMRSTADAWSALSSGFTSIREMGGMGAIMARVIDAGSLTGPSIYGAGATLSMTAGHADIHGIPLDLARETFRSHWGEHGIVDGADQARAGVRRMLRMGARVIKIHASGGVISEIDDPLLPQFSAAELKAIVDEATRMGRVVGAHCHGKRGIMAALEAGIKTIEHGTYLDDEAADAMVETGAILVPTRFIVGYLLEQGKRRGIQDHSLRKLLQVSENHAAAVATAKQKGVKIAMGTDIFMTGVWGRNAEELGFMVADGGMTPLEAIETATATAPETLGPQAPNSGQLAAGKDADVICVSGNPALDVGVLADPTNITHVFKLGVRYKG